MCIAIARCSTQAQIEHIFSNTDMYMALCMRVLAIKPCRLLVTPHIAAVELDNISLSSDITMYTRNGNGNDNGNGQHSTVSGGNSYLAAVDVLQAVEDADDVSETTVPAQLHLQQQLQQGEQAQQQQFQQQQLQQPFETPDAETRQQFEASECTGCAFGLDSSTVVGHLANSSSGNNDDNCGSVAAAGATDTAGTAAAAYGVHSAVDVQTAIAQLR
jgi:hypothetical protein